MIRVLIVSDIRLYLEGLAVILGREDQIEVVETCDGLDTALAAAGRVSPHVVLLDMAMPDSLIVIREMKEFDLSIQVVALGVPEIEREVIACAEAGASGYVPRQASLSELILAVRCAVRGELRCSPKIAAGLLRRVRTLAAEPSPEGDASRLTAREMEIACLIDRGLTNKEIANRLCIEVSTVKNHVHNLLEKLNARRRGEAVARLRPLLVRFSAERAELDPQY
jgi:DNA-binding NarL/FixJ family response regulator